MHIQELSQVAKGCKAFARYFEITGTGMSMGRTLFGGIFPHLCWEGGVPTSDAILALSSLHAAASVCFLKVPVLGRLKGIHTEATLLEVPCFNTSWQGTFVRAAWSIAQS